MVRTIIKDTNTPGQSRDFLSMINSEIRAGQNRKTGLNNATVDPEVDNEMTFESENQSPNLDQQSYLGSTG